MDTTNTVNIHVYGRYSDPKQDKSLTIQTQLFHDACDDLIPQLFGGRKGNIVGSYADEGISASKKKVKRKDFNRLLGDIEGGSVKILMVLNLSRFARLHHIDAMELHIKLHRHNVMLVSIDDRKIVSIDDLAQFILVAFQSSKDHEYARTVGMNCLRGSIRSVRSGQAVCQTTPYGMAKLYVTDQGNIVVKRNDRLAKSKDWKHYLIEGDKLEADTVRWIFQEYADTDKSPAYIARILNRHSDPTIRQGIKGRGWCEESIKYMLLNRHYNGKVYIGTRPTGEHYRTNTTDVAQASEVTTPAPLIRDQAYQSDPIINDELWQRVQKKLQHNKATGRRAYTREDHEGHPLTGIIYCGHCGRSMGSHNKKHLRYQCRNKVRCHYWSVSEKEMLSFIFKRIDRELLAKLDTTPPSGDDGYDDAIGYLCEINDRIESLQASLKHAAIPSIPSITQTINALLEERNAISSSINKITEYDRVSLAYDRWQELIQPLCVGIKTGDQGDDNEAVRHLDIQDEVDRLFNTTYARPSAIRNLLHTLECRVECHFTKGEKGYTLDRGRLSATIEGVKYTDRTNNQDTANPSTVIRSRLFLDIPFTADEVRRRAG